ncbi:MAG: hypothetical protein Q9207_004791, partial [Kuettlingeria erythrocarpa]
MADTSKSRFRTAAKVLSVAQRFEEEGQVRGQERKRKGKIPPPSDPPDSYSAQPGTSGAPAPYGGQYTGSASWYPPASTGSTGYHPPYAGQQTSGSWYPPSVASQQGWQDPYQQTQYQQQQFSNHSMNPSAHQPPTAYPQQSHSQLSPSPYSQFPNQSNTWDTAGTPSYESSSTSAPYAQHHDHPAYAPTHQQSPPRPTPQAHPSYHGQSNYSQQSRSSP